MVPAAPRRSRATFAKPTRPHQLLAQRSQDFTIRVNWTSARFSLDHSFKIPDARELLAAYVHRLRARTPQPSCCFDCVDARLAPISFATSEQPLDAYAIVATELWMRPRCWAHDICCVIARTLLLSLRMPKLCQSVRASSFGKRVLVTIAMLSPQRRRCCERRWRVATTVSTI